MDNIQYISPSQFYYWEKCPLQAVLSKLSSTKLFFPVQPDADLGSLIHKFYDRQNEWGIDSVEKFNEKWKDEIDKLNRQYQSNELQEGYYSIQWNAKYYAIKKQLLCNTLLAKKSKVKEDITKDVKYLYEQWISNEIIGGKIDLLVKENDIVKQIIDFKTGNIYQKVDKKIRLKEVYKQQLALYSAVIIEDQDFMPELLIETIDGKQIKIEAPREYIESLTSRARFLKNKINSSIVNNTTETLANCNSENCGYCNYRPLCKSYKSTLINNRIGFRIDLCGIITNIKTNEIVIETTNNHYIIKNIRDIFKYQVNSKCEIYNLYFPDDSDNFLFETINTVIRYV